jgi:hypothetical protein
MRKLNSKLNYISYVIVLFSFISCKKDIKTSEVYIRKQWRVDLSPSNMVPALSTRTDHAVAFIYLMDNNELSYYVYFDKALSSGDSPTGSAIFIGAAGSVGNLFVNLDGSFNEKRESDNKINLSAEMANSMVASPNLYLQVASVQLPSGLVRGQLQ